jgi:hypothetical protein
MLLITSPKENEITWVIIIPMLFCNDKKSMIHHTDELKNVVG